MIPALAVAALGILFLGLALGMPQANLCVKAEVVLYGAVPGQYGILQGEQVQMMSADELTGLMDSGRSFVLIDARPAYEFSQAHIPGAISMPLDLIDRLAAGLDKSQMIVTYCGNLHCPISTKAANELRRLGFQNVYDYKGGMQEWAQKGYKVESG